MINFTINDWEVSGEDAWTILEVARKHGIDIPTLLHHGAVEPAALRSRP
jgi:heterodisulfide reductase subunit A2